MKKVALIGSGEFAQQIRSIFNGFEDYQIVGYFDDTKEINSIVNGLPILGTVDDVELLYKNKVFELLFVAAGYSNFEFRERVYEKYANKIGFATIVEPSAYIGFNVRIGEGVYIGRNCYIASNSKVGNNVFMHAGTTIGHDNMIGDHTYISGRFDTCGRVIIGKRCFIGVRCLISDHVTVSDDVWIGIGSMVLKDILQPGKYMTVSRLMKLE